MYCIRIHVGWDLKDSKLDRLRLRNVDIFTNLGGGRTV